MLKVAHLSHGYNVGGAALVAHQLHENLHSRQLVQSNFISAFGLNPGSSSTLRFLSNKKPSRVINLLKRKIADSILTLQRTSNPNYRSLSLFPSGTLKRLNLCTPDLVHLHWVQGELLSIEEIARIQQPIVWTLHDSWPFLGSEHHPSDVNDCRFHHSYTSQNRPRTSFGIDIDAWTWWRKKRAWQGLDPVFVAPSTWLASQLRQSALFHRSQVVVIPNPVSEVFFNCPSTDTLVSFKNRYLPREIHNSRLVVAGSAFAENDKNKNFQAISSLPRSLSDRFVATTFVTFGNQSISTYKYNPAANTTHLGRLSKDDLSCLLHLASLVVVPSLQESFCLVAAEAQATSTPVVALKGTGIDDIVINGVTGLTTTCDELVSASLSILENPSWEKKLSISAFKQVASKYMLDAVVDQYLSLYYAVTSVNS